MNPWRKIQERRFSCWRCGKWADRTELDWDTSQCRDSHGCQYRANIGAQHTHIALANFSSRQISRTPLSYGHHVIRRLALRIKLQQAVAQGLPPLLGLLMIQMLIVGFAQLCLVTVVADTAAHLKRTPQYL